MNRRFDESSRMLIGAIEQIAQELHLAYATPVQLDSSLDKDIGLDSLGRMELLSRIERLFGIVFSETAMASAATPRDLLAEIVRLGPQAPSGAPQDITRPRPAAFVAPVDIAAKGARTLVEVLDRWALGAGDRVHIILADTDERITYGQLREYAAQVASGLLARGLEPGQTVAIMLPTGPEYFYSFYGVLMAGGVPVPIYPPARIAQIEDHLRRHGDILKSAGVSFLITASEARAVARLLQAATPALRHVTTATELATTRAIASRAAQPGDLALLQYTSGSTGTPKGVMLTHANLLANIRALGMAIQVTPEDVFVSWLPLYHDMGLIGAWLGSLYHGIPLVVMTPLAFLARPERWLKAIADNHGTLSAAPNFAYELCVRKITDRDIEGLDLRSWRLAFNGAEAVSAATIARFTQRFAACGLRPEAMAPVYGLAECSVGLAVPCTRRPPVVHHVRRDPLQHAGRVVRTSAGRVDTIALVACGQALPGHEIRIVGTTGNTLGDYQEGELQFRGPSATQGYFHNEPASAALFDGDWLISGDRAYQADGDIFVTGRVKDIIIRAGRNLYPQEVEEVTGAIPGIRKGCVAAFGHPDPATGTDRLVIMAETRETADDTRAGLRQKVHRQVTTSLGEPADDIVLVPPHTIPKTSSGKIRRHAARAVYEYSIRSGRRPSPAWYAIARLAAAGILGRVYARARQAKDLLYGAYAWLAFAACAPLAWILTAASRDPATAWRLNHRAARVFLRLTGIRIDVHGLAHMPSDRPCVVVANHASYVDGIVLAAALSGPFAFVAKREFLDHWIPRIYLRRIGARFIERFRLKDSLLGLDELRRALGAGQSLILFPEGTFRPQSGLLAFRMGAFRVAAQAGVPIVPIAIHGSRPILRDQSLLPRHGRITVIVTPPVSASGSTWPAALQARDEARAQILAHCGERDAT